MIGADPNLWPRVVMMYDLRMAPAPMLGSVLWALFLMVTGSRMMHTALSPLYMAIPLGSSSEAPVIRPGPMI